jgi:hypothetical protein
VRELSFFYVKRVYCSTEHFPLFIYVQYIFSHAYSAVLLKPGFDPRFIGIGLSQAKFRSVVWSTPGKRPVRSGELKDLDQVGINVTYLDADQYRLLGNLPIMIEFKHR